MKSFLWLIWLVWADDFGGDTAFPILFIGNLADNVTPLQSAWNNSAKFPSSRVLVQNSYGVSFSLPFFLPRPLYCFAPFFLSFEKRKKKGVGEKGQQAVSAMTSPQT